MLICAGVASAAVQADGRNKEAAKLASFDELDSTIITDLTPEERQHSVVYIDQHLFPAGPAQIGGQAIDVANPYVIAFIDRRPGANWMHPCRYLLIDPIDRHVVSVDSNRPPAFGRLPSGWRIVMRSPEIEDWQVMPITSGPPP